MKLLEVLKHWVHKRSDLSSNLLKFIMWKKLNRFFKENHSLLITAPSVAAVLIIFRLSGFLQLLEWAALDQFFRLRPSEIKDSRIIIVGISETDIRKIGQWPIPDGILAESIEKIKQQQPRVIGLDLYRDLPVQPGHEKLVNLFKTTPNLIGIKKVIDSSSSFAVNPPPALQEKDQIGANDLILDSDGKVRRGLLFMEDKAGNLVTHFSLKVAFKYLQNEGIIPKSAVSNPDFLQLKNQVFPRFQSNDGGYVRTANGGYQVLVNFRGAQNTFTIVPLTDLLENRISPDLMKDRIVLIGSIAASLQDYYSTPYDSGLNSSPQRTSGVEIHANMTSQIISAALEERPLIKGWSEPVEWLWIFTWSVIGVALGWLGRSLPTKYRFYSEYWALITIVISGVSLIGSSYLAFLAGWWIPVVPSLLALLGSAFAITSYIANLERKERQTLMQLFERRVTPKLAASLWEERDKLLEDGQVQGQELIATVLFTDLKGFSTIAENMTPKMLMGWLNNYMQTMAQIVLDNDGIIDKFIGDAVMAVFGVPIPSITNEEIALDVQKAVNCAVEMGKALKFLNQEWQNKGLPSVSMRVGIATGAVVAGSLGSALRQDYTIIGDTVNIASRLESYDKSIDGGICRILISEETYEYCQDKFVTKVVGTVVLKGRSQPVKVYQVLVE
ncbi:MAG TPA: adenylate/guanylate cyclase domain-containing protein [Leptolyngbyaceae cyanobacterium]